MSERDALLALVRGAAGALELARQRIDDLNVYPVPDGDTGTNLALTARSVVAALELSTETDLPPLAHALSRAALMGARGNSGVILSQIVRGAAEVLAGAERVDGAAVARAFRSASDEAYRAVREPAEGTMLTMIRELAEAAEARTELAVPTLLQDLLRRGDEVLAHTPEQLDVLREAGVVDAGAAGLLEALRGLTAALTGEALPEHPKLAAPPSAVGHELSRYRYCTAFVVEGRELELARLEEELDPLGDSLLVVGDSRVAKIHVHTDDPGAALTIGARQGTLEQVEIANMQRQTAERAARLRETHRAPVSATVAVAVVAGAGNRRLFESLGARVVEGGQSMNPTAAGLVEAIESAGAAEAVVLPNNPNVLLVAEQAAGLASKPTHVVATRSIPAGLAAMVVFDPARSGSENVDALEGVLREVASAAVTIASRDVELNGLAVRKGDYLGLVEGEPVAGGKGFEEVARSVAERLLAQPRDVLTLLAGVDGPPLTTLLRELEERHPHLELEVHEGGQPHYPLLLGAE